VSPDGQSAGGLAAFGRYLVQARELRGLSREDVVRATRLPAAAIDAIEAGDAERSPHRAYVVVYLRGYAAAVGLDPDDVLLRYEEANGGPPPGPPPRRLGPLGAVLALLFLGAVAIAAIAWWSVQR
jgi:cytoskeletal protein RodZ